MVRFAVMNLFLPIGERGFPQDRQMVIVSNTILKKNLLTSFLVLHIIPHGNI